MRVCKNLWMAKKKHKEDLKDRVKYLQKKVDMLEGVVCELQERVTQLESFF